MSLRPISPKAVLSAFILGVAVFDVLATQAWYTEHRTLTDEINFIWRPVLNRGMAYFTTYKLALTGACLLLLNRYEGKFTSAALMVCAVVYGIVGLLQIYALILLMK